MELSGQIPVPEMTALPYIRPKLEIGIVHWFNPFSQYDCILIQKADEWPGDAPAGLLPLGHPRYRPLLGA